MWKPKRRARKREKKNFLSGKIERFIGRKRLGKCTLINSLWYLWCVCVHACVCDWLRNQFHHWWCVCVEGGGRYVQHLWRFLKLCASVRACVCISLFDWHQFLSGCVCTLWSKLPRFRPPISSSCEAPESSEVGHSISLKVNWTAGCVQPACSQAQYYTIHPQATTRSPETATFLLNLSSPVYLLHPKLC